MCFPSLHKKITMTTNEASDYPKYMYDLERSEVVGETEVLVQQQVVLGSSLVIYFTTPFILLFTTHSYIFFFISFRSSYHQLIIGVRQILVRIIILKCCKLFLLLSN